MEDIRIARIADTTAAAITVPQITRSNKAKTGLTPEGAKREIQQKESPVVPNPGIDQLIERANQIASANNKEIKFRLDNDGNPPVIIISDKKTGEILRQIPSEEMLRLSDKMEDFIGLIFNRRY